MRRSGFRRFRFACIVAAALVAMSGSCGKPDRARGRGPVTIEVQMFSGPEHEAMVPTARYWNEHHAAESGIEVEVTALNRVGYFDKLETQLVAGLATPDVVHPFSLQLGALMPHLEPLDRFLDDDEAMTAPDGSRLSREVYLDTALRTVAASDGKTYMLPIDLSSVILYYRKDLIPSPPETWDEFVATARRFTRGLNPDSPTEYGAVMQGKYEIWTFCAALENIWPYGGRLLDPATGKPDLDNAGTVQAFKVFEDLARSGALPPGSVNAEYPEVAAMVLDGEVAMAVQWNAFYQEIARAGPGVLGEFDIAPPPGVRQADGRLRRDMYVQTICLALNRASKHKRAAARFMAWATMGEGAVIYARGGNGSAGGSAPIRPVWDDAGVSDLFPRLRPWVEAHGRSVMIDRRVTEIMMVGASWVQRVMSGQATAEEAAAGLNREVAELLAKRGGD